MITRCPCGVTSGGECVCPLVDQRDLEDGPCDQCGARARRWPVVASDDGAEVELCRACWCEGFGVGLGALAALRALLGHDEWMEAREWDRHWASCALCALVVRREVDPALLLRRFRPLGRERDLSPRWNRRGLRRTDTEIGDRDPDGRGDPFVYWGVVEEGYSGAPDGFARRVVEAYMLEEEAVLDARMRAKHDGYVWWAVPLVGARELVAFRAEGRASLPWRWESQAVTTC